VVQAGPANRPKLVELMTEPEDSAKQLMIWQGWCFLELPANWSWIEEEGVITISRKDGVGALQLSFATRERRGAVDANESIELANSWARARGWTDIGLRQSVLAGGPAVEIEHVETTGPERTYWKVWQLVERRRAALMTYVCDAGESEAERDAREQIVASFSWR